MIRVDIREEAKRHGVFEWSVKTLALSGSSRQPLLDAARAVQRMGAHPKQKLGLFRDGRTMPDLTALVGVAAGLTVSEPNKGGITFVKFQEFAGIGERLEAAE